MIKSPYEIGQADFWDGRELTETDNPFVNVCPKSKSEWERGWLAAANEINTAGDTVPMSDIYRVTGEPVA